MHNEHAGAFGIGPYAIGTLAYINLFSNTRSLGTAADHYDFVQTSHRHIGVGSGDSFVGKADLLAVRVGGKLRCTILRTVSRNGCMTCCLVGWWFDAAVRSDSWSLVPFLNVPNYTL
jgi:hypothetical protein